MSEPAGSGPRSWPEASSGSVAAADGASSGFGLRAGVRSGGEAADPIVEPAAESGSDAGGVVPLPRRVPQVPPPPFGVAVSPGGASLFMPPKRRPRVPRLRETEPSVEPAPVVPPAAATPPVTTPRWAPHPPVKPDAELPSWDRPADIAGAGRPDPVGWTRAVPDTSLPEPGEWNRVPTPVETPDPGPERALPPVAGQALPPVADVPRRDPGAAAIDEATTFMSQWGPPPLTVPRPTSEPTQEPAADRGWGLSRPGPEADGPTPPTPRATAAWTRAQTPEPPAPTEERAPTETGAERWIADRLAADRAAADHAAAADATDRAASAAADRAAADRAAVDRAASTSAAADRAAADRAAATRATANRAAGASAANPTRDRQPDADPATGTADRVTGRADAAERAYVEDATEVIGPFDIGSWSLQGQDGAQAPARPRTGRRAGRQDAGRQDAGRTDTARTDAGRTDTGRTDTARTDRGRTDNARANPDRAEAEDRDLVAVGGGRGPRPPSDGSGGGGSRGGGNGGDDAGPPRHTTGDRVRTVIRGVGQLLLTLGAILLLLVVYEVYFTDLVNDRTQSRLKNQLEQEWDNGDDPVVAAQTPAQPGAAVRSIPLGDGFALIYVPDFGTDYVYTVVEGTGVDELNEGPGHYVDTPLPGSVGNVAIAGHRVGKGSPFLNLDKLKAGSAIVIRTKTYWYTYRVLGDTRTGDATKMTSLGIPGREIVDPADVGVIAPVPNHPDATPTRRLLTLTTCHPKFSARQRMVIHAVQEGAPYPTSKGTPPAMTG